MTIHTEGLANQDSVINQKVLGREGGNLLLTIFYAELHFSVLAEDLADSDSSVLAQTEREGGREGGGEGGTGRQMDIQR